jgi:hypothetical protein
MAQSTVFNEAFEDYFHFLHKGYSGKALLKLVCDHYKLSGEERSMLFRGVFSPVEIAHRKARLIVPEELTGHILAVDTLNELFTIASYLSGSKVYLATDGLLRDASEKHGSSFPEGIVERSAGLLTDTLLKLGPLHTDFFIDKKMNCSQEIASMIRFSTFEDQLPHQVILSDSVDKDLILSKNVILSTSDTQVIDKSDNPVFDLAHFILLREFNATFTDLNDLLLKKM